MGLSVAMGIVPLNPSYLCAKTGYGLQADWPLMADSNQKRPIAVDPTPSDTPRKPGSTHRFSLRGRPSLSP